MWNSDADHCKADYDNHSNQCNPHCKADYDNHSNQCNPNNPEYDHSHGN